MVICGYTDRYYADRGWWRRWCWLDPNHDDIHFSPPTPSVPLSELFRNLRNARIAGTAEIEASLRPAEITVPGHEVDMASTSARTGVGQISRLARDNGWETKVGRSEAFSGDKLQVNGKVKLGANVEHWWVESVKTPHHFTYSLTDIRLDGRVVTKDELKEAITNA